MYEVTADGDLLCSPSFEDSALINPKLTLEANKAGSFEFTMLPNHPCYSSLVFHQTIIDVTQGSEVLFEGVPVSESIDFLNRKTITCEGELSFLNDTVQRPHNYSSQTALSYLGALLSEHNAQADLNKQFAVGSVTVNASGLNVVTAYNTTMQEISDDLQKPFGGYFRIRHVSGVRYLDYLNDSPRTCKQIIKIGSNLMDLTQNLSSLDICTVLIPLGARQNTQTIPGVDDRLTVKSVNANKDYIVSTASGTYGNIWRTAIFDNITSASTLLSTAQAYLTDAQWANLVIKAKAFDLGLAVSDVEQFRILDKIRVVSAPHGLDRYFLLTKMTLDLNNPANTTITLGEEKTLSLSAQTANVSDTVQREVVQIQTSAAENARQILDSATGGNIYFVYDANGVCEEIRIMDTNDPNTATKWWRWNINGWGYTADAGQTYTIAATMNGAINADFITAGTLVGREINNGSGTFHVTSAGDLTASSGQIGNWSISGGKLSSSDNTVYLSPNGNEYALMTSGAQIGHNGDLQTVGKINLVNANASIRLNDVAIVQGTSATVVRFGYSNVAFVMDSSGGGLELVLNGTPYTIVRDSSGYLKANPQTP